MMDIVQALIGISAIFFIAWISSTDRKKINWRTVLSAFALQVFFAAMVLWFPWGKSVLLSITNAVNSVIDYSQQGINFIFGDIGRQKLGFIFAFQVLPVIVFFSSLIAVLYYLGIMSKVIRIVGGFLHRVLGTSRAESMSATANVFVGQIEAPLVIKPYLPILTRSELFTVMVGGLASVSGSVLAGFASIGVNLEYLIAASFMAAPAGLLIAKILMPEIEAPHQNVDVAREVTQHANIIDAASTGAINGLKLAANIGAVLLAFVGLIALLNGLLGGIGNWFGVENLSLQWLLGYAFQPVAYLMGVPWQEASTAGSLIGQKIVINEFFAFLEFMKVSDTFSEKTQVIVTFALCGFANFGSIAVLLGGLGSLAENRRQDIARYGLKAVFAGTLANLLSATVAGMFFSIAQAS
ncbi:NupC/NupG family nucleoside CNT transporter [Pleionea litopenaei]|uniref:Nucleoside permease n=1 Tax=Pleionea litopenaei TaxID=3070815 RepID=A0AA51RRN2_9GAMM|nr:NupC/NupG family nucleoside CNT transporter [Pleionea sp. HL-JVS1]WMS86403.1 NupC/NupG family nucleoside CNT transporter [Pleionea sp. HL-JVS1]